MLLDKETEVVLRELQGIFGGEGYPPETQILAEIYFDLLTRESCELAYGLDEYPEFYEGERDPFQEVETFLEDLLGRASNFLVLTQYGQSEGWMA